jgi:hypothetical protein
MTVRIFNQPMKHRAVPSVWPLLVTLCGIKFYWDPTGYRYAQRVTDNPEPRDMCPACVA